MGYSTPSPTSVHEVNGVTTFYLSSVRFVAFDIRGVYVLWAPDKSSQMVGHWIIQPTLTELISWATRWLRSEDATQSDYGL